MFFIDQDHRNRFDKYTKNYEAHNNFCSAVYLLSTKKELCNDDLIGPGEIEFYHFEIENLGRVASKIVSLAWTLYDASITSSEVEISIIDVVSFDENIFEATYTAMLIKRIGLIETTKKTIGRKKKVSYEKVQEMKKQGMTQEQTAFLLKVSLTTVKRNWK